MNLPILKTQLAFSLKAQEITSNQNDPFAKAVRTIRIRALRESIAKLET